MKERKSKVSNEGKQTERKSKERKNGRKKQTKKEGKKYLNVPLFKIEP